MVQLSVVPPPALQEKAELLLDSDQSATDEDAARVLLIDDDPGTRIAVGHALRSEGYAVEEAEDGIAGLEAFRRAPADVVLLDVMMPWVDGFQTCREIRALNNGRYAPIVMITGLEDTEWIDKAFEAGATTFFRKPLNFELLGRRLRYVIRSKRVYDKLAASEAQLADAQRLAKIGHWEWQRETGLITCSPSLCDILGLPTDNPHLRYASFLDLLKPAARRDVEDTISEALRRRRKLKLEHWVLTERDEEKFIYQEAEIHRDAQRRVTRVIGIAQDITERKQAEERIKYLAYFDPVTGLPNRTLLRTLLDNGMRRAEESPGCLAILFIDLDNFKKINDVYGHDVGDTVLKEAAERMVNSLRIGDAISRQDDRKDFGDIAFGERAAATRHGGDEFVVVLSEVRSTDGAASVARRIGSVLSELYRIGDRETSITASIGIAVYPRDGANAESLLKNAEAAMYDAKDQGRNRHCFYSRHLHDKLMRKVSLEVDLRQAVAENQLSLFYQPKIDLRTGHVIGAEALLRWHHPSGSLIPPTEFVPIAEESGLIVPIGDWVIRTACAATASWRAHGLPAIKIAVNLSAAQFVHRSLTVRVAEALRETGLPAESLILELTESILVDDIELSIELLREIKALGVGISIDDFGTGYSSLNYLKQLPLSELKIDRSFVRNVPKDPNDAAIVNATIALAQNLRLRTVAEGVERREQMDFLRSVGCDQVQGFLISRPLPEAAFEAWLRDTAPTVAA